MTDEVFKAAHNLGYAEFLGGDLPSALRLMAAADDPKITVSRGVALLDRARVLAAAGMLRAADSTLATAATVFKDEQLAQDLGEVELERARCALALGDALRAKELARAARRHFEQRGNVRARQSSDLVGLQADLATGRHAARTVRAAESLRADLRAQRLRLPAQAATLITAEAYLAAGDADRAVAVLADLGRARRTDPITGRMHSHYVHALADATRGRRRQASRRVRTALGELADYQASFGSIDLRTAAAVHGRRLAELNIGLAIGTGRPASVFAAAERARAVTSRIAPVRPPADGVTAQLLAELRQLLDALRSVELDRAASEPLLRRRRELERQITARSWTRSGDGGVQRVAVLPAVRARLAATECVLVTYVQTGDRLWAIVVGEHLQLLELGDVAVVTELTRRIRADLDVVAQHLLPVAMRNAVHRSLRRSLRELDATLVQPLTLAGRPLVVVTTGVLGQLPWASLPSLRAVPVTVAPSATAWLRCAVASSVLTPVVGVVSGPGLARAASEAAAVGARWSEARVITGPRATGAAFVAALSQSTVLHVAAHGAHQAESPLFSSLRMADGAVFAHDLDRHAHVPEHVVLSACEVGLATVRPGDEALGLASVLLSLGTRSVVAGVARIGDQVAERTMTDYHARLAAGADSAVALAESLAETDADVVPPFVNFGAAWSWRPKTGCD